MAAQVYSSHSYMETLFIIETLLWEYVIISSDLVPLIKIEDKLIKENTPSITNSYIKCIVSKIMTLDLDTTSGEISRVEFQNTLMWIHQYFQKNQMHVILCIFPKSLVIQDTTNEIYYDYDIDEDSDEESDDSMLNFVDTIPDINSPENNITGNFSNVECYQQWHTACLDRIRRSRG